MNEQINENEILYYSSLKPIILITAFVVCCIYGCAVARFHIIASAGLYMHDVILEKFTFAISSPDEFLL